MHRLCVNLTSQHFGRNFIGHLPVSRFFMGFFSLHTRATMSEYFKYLCQMLSIAGESFEEELWCLRFSVTQLNPMEVLETLLYAQRHLGHEFSKEEFKEGGVGNILIPEDFKFTKLVSMQNSY